MSDVSLPFAYLSEVDAVTNAFRQGVHVGRKREAGKYILPAQRSPMPFGSESMSDCSLTFKRFPATGRVTNAFRQGVHVGLYIATLNPEPGTLMKEVTNAFRQGVHVGPEKTSRWVRVWNGLVTNAFRQGVHVGLNVNAEIAFLTKEVTNAFRQGVHVGRAGGPLQAGPPRGVTNAFRQGVHVGLIS